MTSTKEVVIKDGYTRSELKAMGANNIVVLDSYKFHWWISAETNDGVLIEIECTRWPSDFNDYAYRFTPMGGWEKWLYLLGERIDKNVSVKLNGKVIDVIRVRGETVASDTDDSETESDDSGDDGGHAQAATQSN